MVQRSVAKLRENSKNLNANPFFRDCMLTEIHGRLSYKQSQYGFFVVELGIGDVKIPEAIISTALGYFAAIPEESFRHLEKSGVIRDAHDVDPTDHYTTPRSRVGYANIWVIGTEESIVPVKLYRNATVAHTAGMDPEIAYLGLPFVHDFDVAEFWKNSGECILRLSLSQNLVELFDDRPDKKVGFYGLRDSKVTDITDLLA